MRNYRLGAYSIDSVHIALLFARKEAAKPRPYFTLETLTRLIAASDKAAK